MKLRHIRLPDQEPVFGGQVHRRAFRHGRIGFVELVKVLHRKVDPDIREGMGVVFDVPRYNVFDVTAHEVITNMMMTLHEAATPAAVKVRIYELVLDRLMGKPEATIRLEDNTEDMEEAERFVEMMAEEIRKEIGE